MNEISARESFDLVTSSGMKLSREMKFKTTKLQDELVAKKQKLQHESDNEMEVENSLDTSKDTDKSTNEIKKEFSDKVVCDSTLKIEISSSDDSDGILPQKCSRDSSVNFVKSDTLIEGPSRIMLKHMLGKNTTVICV